MLLVLSTHGLSSTSNAPRNLVAPREISLDRTAEPHEAIQKIAAPSRACEASSDSREKSLPDPSHGACPKLALKRLEVNMVDLVFQEGHLLTAARLKARILCHLRHFDQRPAMPLTKNLMSSTPPLSRHALHLAGLAIAAFILALTTASHAELPETRPNVIVFVADDLGWADPGFRGGPIETPSLDALAREGLEFERFYTTPICSPTRAALHTGRDPMRLGVAYNTIMAWHNNGVHPDERLSRIFLMNRPQAWHPLPSAPSLIGSTANRVASSTTASPTRCQTANFASSSGVWAWSRAPHRAC